MSSLGSRIRDLREEKNLTQSQLAHALGIKNQSVVAYWETDHNRPNIDRIVQMCDFFGVSSDFLLGRCERSTTPTSDETALLSKLRDLDDRGRQTVYNIAEYEHSLRNDSSVGKEYPSIQMHSDHNDSPSPPKNDFPLFIETPHPAFDEMCKKSAELKQLKKKTGATTEGITRFLWLLGYEKVCMLDVISVMRGLQTPHPRFYHDIRAYLTRSFDLNVWEDQQDD